MGISLPSWSVAALAVLGAFHFNTLSAAPIVGGTTTVVLDSATLAVIVGAGVTPAPFGSATLDTSGPVVASFPITGGNTMPLTIEHDGSGLSFTVGANTVDIINFLIDFTNPADALISGGVLLNGSTVVASGFRLFEIDSNLGLSLSADAGAALASNLGIPDLGGAFIGTASTSPVVVPEPSSILMLGAGLASLALLSRRRMS